MGGGGVELQARNRVEARLFDRTPLVFDLSDAARSIWRGARRKQDCQLARSVVDRTAASTRIAASDVPTLRRRNKTVRADPADGQEPPRAAATHRHDSRASTASQGSVGAVP